MVLSALRFVDRPEGLSEVIICEESDFENSLAIIDILLSHAIKLFVKLNKEEVNVGALNSMELELNRQKLVVKYHSEQKSIRQIALDVYGDENKKSKVHRIIKKYLESRNI